MKTSELTGAALDWAVAKCEGITLNEGNTVTNDCDVFAPSIDWERGGPIIEREEICLTVDDGQWTAEINAHSFHNRKHHQSPLIAAMRCYVASKLGDEVTIPDELMEAA